MNNRPQRILSDEQAADLLAAMEQTAAEMEKFRERMLKAGMQMLAGAEACMREWQTKQAQNVSLDACDEPEDGG